MQAKTTAAVVGEVVRILVVTTERAMHENSRPLLFLLAVVSLGIATQGVAAAKQLV